MNGIKIYTLIAACIVLQATNVAAQAIATKNTIAGHVVDEQGKPISGANVRLYSFPDSVRLADVQTDSIGNFSFKNLHIGMYQFDINYLGFVELKRQVKLDAENPMVRQNIALIPVTNSLSTITISGNRAQVERQLDRTILNVDQGATNVGVSILEVLEKAPGVSIDQNGSISMKGKSGVMVMINDKPVQLSGTELSEMLKGIASNNVDKVELITTPPAKYDAAGVSGIINLKMKRSTLNGLNGNISISGGHGELAKSNNGGNINYHTTSLNLYGNYNYSRRGDFVRMDVLRNFSEGTFGQDYDQDIDYGSHNLRVGLDYKVTKRGTLGGDFFGNFVKIDRITNSLSTLSNYPGASDERQKSYNTTLNARNNYGVNLNFEQRLATTGSSLTIDLDYARYTMDDHQTYDVRYQNVQHLSKAPLSLFNNSEGNLQIKSGGINYLKSMMGIKFETGLKASFINSIALLDFYNESSGVPVFDPKLSNAFEYQEDIKSAYLNASSSVNPFKFQLGLRMESTQANGRKLAEAHGFNRDYTQLFPSASMSYEVDQHHSVGLALSRRISRPTFNQINPFFYFLDLSTRFSGNPELLPALGYSTELNYIYKGKYIFSLGYFNTKRPIMDTQLTSEEDSKLIIQQPINLDRNEVFSINATVPVRISSWFSSQNNLGFYYGVYQGTVQNAKLAFSRPYFNLNTSNTFTYTNWSLQLVGNYNGRQYAGNNEISPIRTLNIALQRRLMAKKATIGLNFSDVFWSNVIRSNSAVPAFNNQLFWRRDSRMLTLNFSYRFGGKNETSDRKKGSAEEEKRRAS